MSNNLFNSTKVFLTDENSTTEVKAVQVDGTLNLPIQNVTVNGQITYQSTPVFNAGISVPNGSVKVGTNTTIQASGITTNGLVVKNNSFETSITTNKISVPGNILAKNIPFAWAYVRSTNASTWDRTNDHSSNITKINLYTNDSYIDSIEFDSFTQGWMSNASNNRYYLFLGSKRTEGNNQSSWTGRNYSPSYFGSEVLILVFAQ